MNDRPPLTSRPWLVACVIALAVLGAYANSLNNGFHLDDWHGLNDNPLIRSLRHIPSYFADPTTLSTSRLHADYRPLLQVTFALNYAISGYDLWSWHALNLILHATCAISLYLMGRLLFGSRRLLPITWMPERTGDAAAFAAGLIFAVHPVTTACSNYMWARSTLLTAALAMPAVVLYLSGLREGRRALWFVIPALLAAGSILSKIEGASVVAVFIAAETLVSPDGAFVPLWRRLFRVPALLRLAPAIVVLAVYLGGRGALIPWSHYDDWGQYNVSRLVYFQTQLTAWWYYVSKVIAPIDQVADYGAYPVIRSMADPRLILAASGWLAVGILALACLRRAPQFTFLAASFFLYLGPHSSFAPLAEMVNEHRPYLPDANLILLLSVGLAALCAALWTRPRLATAAAAFAVAVPLGYLTHVRNRVFKDELTYWKDVAEKDPGSGRAQMNYGLELQKIGRAAEAERLYREAIRLWPSYHYAFTNLALLLAARGDLEGARINYDLAVQNAGTIAIPYYYRGLFRLQQGELQGAADDLAEAVRRTAIPVRERVALADTYLRLGRDEEAAQTVLDGLVHDPGAFSHHAQKMVERGVAHMEAGRLDTAEKCFTAAASVRGQFALPHINLGILRNFQNRPEEARACFDWAVAAEPTSPNPYRWRADFYDKAGRIEDALTDYRKAAELTDRPVQDLSALAEALLKAGKRDEAAAAIAKGESFDKAAFAPLRARLGN